MIRVWIGSVSLPVAPENIRRSGAAALVKYDLLEPGEVIIPRGRSTRKIEFGGMLPGAPRRNQPWVFNWRDPLSVSSDLYTYMDNGYIVRFEAQGYLGMDVYVTSYSDNAHHGYGDISYEIQLTEARALTLGFDVGGGGPGRVIRPGRGVAATVKVTTGDDTWRSLSHDQFGDDSHWQDVQRANPNAVVLTDGTLEPNQKITLPGSPVPAP